MTTEVLNADDPVPEQTLAELMQATGRAAVAAAQVLAQAASTQKDQALRAAAAAVRRRRSDLVIANRRDMEEAARKGLRDALLERLKLTDEGIEKMALGLETIAALPDPIGTVLAQWTRPNGLRIQRVRVPLGVIGMIYESRPNVTADAGALSLKSGNAVILRGGSESQHSNRAVHACLIDGLDAAGLPSSAIQLIGTADRAIVGYMLANMREFIDVVVPRGGKSLVARVLQEARVPVIGHLEGNCHVYVDRDADLEMARQVVLNAKLRRTGVCGAAETLLVDRAVAATHLEPIVAALLEAKCEVRGDSSVQRVDTRVRPATEEDWYTEYLDAIIAVKLVEGVDGAIAHIHKYGSAHTESIVTDNDKTAGLFLSLVDSAIVLHNASTQFADGGEFGMGAEIGISTDKFHARGPVGIEQLTSYKYLVHGDGQVRRP